MKKALLLIGLVLLCVMLSAAAYADNVDITVRPDKDSYAVNETITLNIAVTNHTDMVMKDLKITNAIPDGLSYALGAEASAVIPEVPPHSTAQHTLYLIRNDASLPVTGDAFPLCSWVLCIAGSMLGAVLLLRRRGASARNH